VITIFLNALFHLRFTEVPFSLLLTHTLTSETNMISDILHIQAKMQFLN
jgi:hypothetical protein